MTRDDLVTYLTEVMGICGCSDNDQVVKFLFDLLEVAEMRSGGYNEEADETLKEIMPEGDCLERNLPIYWLNSGALIEHGWTMDAFTLSEVGEKVLEALRTHGTGEELWVRDDSTPTEDPGKVWN